MKRFLSLAAGAVLAVTAMPAIAMPKPTVGSAAIHGDLNNDNIIDQKDIRILLSFLTGDPGMAPDLKQMPSLLALADCDNNGVIDARDLTLLKRRASYTEAEPAYIHLKENSISYEGEHVAVSGNTATISASGSYYIDGSLTNGQIIVHVPDETVDTGTVKLYLDGVRMTNGSAPCILVENAKNTSINLVEGKENTLSDGQQAPATETDVELAVLHAKDDLTVKGDGSLTIEAGLLYGIHCNNDLKINGGTLHVTTENADAVRGRTSLTVKAGTVTIDSEGDGLKSTKGNVNISGGDVSIKSGKDAIQAETTLDLTGGTVSACGDRGLKAPDITLDGCTLLATATDNPCETLGTPAQPCMDITLTKLWSKNNPIALTSGGSIVFDRNTLKKFRYALISAPELSRSTGYELYTGGIQMLQSGSGIFQAGTYSDVNNTDSTKLLYAGLFDQSKVHRIEITMANWEEFLRHADEEAYYPCDVIIDGEALQNVGIRTKGNSSRMFVSQANRDKFSWRLKLDKYDKYQNYHGLTELCMNNMYSDPSCMRDILCYRACDEVGSYAPNCAYTDMYLNGQLYSFYFLAEQPGDTLAERLSTSDDAVFYKAADVGNSYDCSFKPSMALNNFEVKWGDDESLSHIAEVQKAINQVSTSNYKFIEDIIDVPSFLQGFAVNAVMCNYDSYNGMMPHNYYLVWNEGKMYYVSWDFNLSLGNFMDNGASVNSDINTGMYQTQVSDRPLLKLLEIPEYKTLYSGYVRQITQMYADPEKTVNGIASLIRDHVKADTRFFFTYEQFENNIAKSANGLQVGGGGGGWGGFPGFGGGFGGMWGGGGGLFSYGGENVSIVDFMIKRNEVIAGTLTN